MCGALLLARDGHDVTVLERDAAPPPDPEDAWNAWDRRGVNQFRMLHFFQPRFRSIAEVELPDVVRAFEGAGARVVNPFREAPAEITGGFRDSDANFDALTARRPVAEAAIAGVVDTAGNVRVRRGVAVQGLLTGPSQYDGVPHVVGVRTESGEEITADLVIDAAGRRSTLPRMLTEVGARAPLEELDDCGFIYYGRHFRSNDGSVPPAFGPLLLAYGSFSALTLPADNGTWGVGLITSAKDAALRALKNADAWERVMKSLPLQAHWVDGEPLEDHPAVMAKIEDRHRAFVIDDTPVATGVLALADSWACTNPSVGRGISIGLIHAVALRDVLRTQPADGVELARAFHAATNVTAEPWYRGTLAFDHGRLDEIHAELEGQPFEPDPFYETILALQSAAGKDPEVLRAFVEIAGVISVPEEALAKPGVSEKVAELGKDWREAKAPGPTREELLAIVNA
jgi:2-polyprenyl-6-methoxyphenol hydroxylase-like FAD-dependent oxidoreductase